MALSAKDLLVNRVGGLTLEEAQKLLAVADAVFPPAADEIVECLFCETATDRDDAPGLGWVSSFWIDETEVHRPVCRNCVAARLALGLLPGSYCLKD